jgi:hypothetical protein
MLALFSTLLANAYRYGEVFDGAALPAAAVRTKRPESIFCRMLLVYKFCYSCVKLYFFCVPGVAGSQILVESSLGRCRR